MDKGAAYSLFYAMLAQPILHVSPYIITYFHFKMSQKYRALFSDFALLIGEERKRPISSDAPAILAQF